MGKKIIQEERPIDSAHARHTKKNRTKIFHLLCPVEKIAAMTRPEGRRPKKAHEKGL